MTAAAKQGGASKDACLLQVAAHLDVALQQRQYLLPVCEGDLLSSQGSSGEADHASAGPKLYHSPASHHAAVCTGSSMSRALQV